MHLNQIARETTFTLLEYKMHIIDSSNLTNYQQRAKLELGFSDTKVEQLQFSVTENRFD